MINKNWDKVLDSEYKKDYFGKLIRKVDHEYNNKDIFPLKNNVFRALTLTDYDKVKVVILGQDPYHGINEANGLAFSVNNGITLPPSLRNIYKELYSDLNIKMPYKGDLTEWAEQGVLLLNSVLTVEKDKPASHKDMGWQLFTDKIIEVLNNKRDPVVFILWGNFARSKKELITNENHFIIESPHPSPFSANRGFFGSKPFSRTNEFLISKNIKPINWKIKE